MHTIPNKKYQPSHHSFLLVMTKCPDSHPYPLGGGLQCCKVSLKLNNSLSSDCDGRRVKFDSSPECCVEGMMQPCSDQEGGCNLAKSEYIPVFFLLPVGLSGTTVLRPQLHLLQGSPCHSLTLGGVWGWILAPNWPKVAGVAPGFEPRTSCMRVRSTSHYATGPVFKH